MGTWVQPFFSSPTFLGAGGSPLGALAGGPITAGVQAGQPLPDRNGQLRMNYSCGCSADGCCNTPMPSGEGTLGVEDDYLCLNWLAITC